MTTTRERRIPGLASFAHRARAEAWLTLVEPVWPRGYVRLLGLAGLAEGVFLLLISGTAPVGEIGMLTLIAGETAFVASFAPAPPTSSSLSPAVIRAEVSHAGREPHKDQGLPDIAVAHDKRNRGRCQGD